MVNENGELIERNDIREQGLVPFVWARIRPLREQTRTNATLILFLVACLCKYKRRRCPHTTLYNMALSYAFVALLLAVGSGAECPVGAIRGSAPLTCYKVYTTPSNWLDAKATCKRDNGHLVSITSMTVNRFLRTLTKNVACATTGYWGGGTQSAEGVWSWTDGSKWFMWQGFDLSTSNWAAGQCGVGIGIPRVKKTYCLDSTYPQRTVGIGARTTIPLFRPNHLAVGRELRCGQCSRKGER